jgi:hypothetical protein
MTTNNEVIICADIGRFSRNQARNNFGWASSDGHLSSDIDQLCEKIAFHLNNSEKICLGLECPLWLPLRDDPALLTSARDEEGNRSWSAAAGACVTVLGIVQSTWIFRRVKDLLKDQEIIAFFNWENFSVATRGVYIWEALVSGNAHGESHIDDAATAVNAFIRKRLEGLQKEKKNDPDRSVVPIIQSALLQANWRIFEDNFNYPVKLVKAEEIDKA